MPAAAIAHVRAMRGGAQAHLLEASDGHFYVVKFANNPQGRRILVNEFLAQRILDHLRLPAPPAALIELSGDFIARSNHGQPRLGMTLGNSFRPPNPGWHLGSRFPGSPSVTLVHDFLAEDSLILCRNLHHFAGALAFDLWTGNTDSRQSIFYRAKLSEAIPDPELAGNATRGLITSFIDHGFCFNGAYWDFPGVTARSLYASRRVYRDVAGWASFEPWIERIRAFPASVLDAAVREMPAAWFDASDEEQLPTLCEALLRRRERVARFIEDVRDREPQTFPRWT
jgi:hypothetical protein